MKKYSEFWDKYIHKLCIFQKYHTRFKKSDWIIIHLFLWFWFSFNFYLAVYVFINCVFFKLFNCKADRRNEVPKYILQQWSKNLSYFFVFIRAYTTFTFYRSLENNEHFIFKNKSKIYKLINTSRVRLNLHE